MMKENKKKEELTLKSLDKAFTKFRKETAQKIKTLETKIAKLSKTQGSQIDAAVKKFDLRGAAKKELLSLKNYYFNIMLPEEMRQQEPATTEKEEGEIGFYY